MLFFEAVAAAQDRDAAGVCREEERSLPGRVPRADDVDVKSVGVRRLAARRAIGDPFSGQPLDPVHREASPRHPAREDDRARAQDIAAVEVELARRRDDPRDRARD